MKTARKTGTLELVTLETLHRDHPAILEAREKAEAAVFNGLPGKGTLIVGRYSRADAVFLREQSAKMKNHGWEDQPDMRSWLDLAVGSVKYIVITALVIGVWLWFR